MMIPSILEKISYVGAIAVLYDQGRVSKVPAASGLPDALFALLFAAAFVKTRGKRDGRG